MMREIIGKNRFIRKLVEKRGTVQHDSGACVYCGKCGRTCPMKAINVRTKERKLEINRDVCVRCESCVKICPRSALRMS